MSYLIVELLFFLLVAAALGSLVGWSAKALLASRHLRVEEESWRRDLRRSEARAGNLKNQLAEANLVEERLRDELSRAEPPAVEGMDPEKVQLLEAELARRDKKIELLKLQVTQSEAALASEWESLKALKLEIADRQRRLDERGKQISGKLRTSEEKQQQLRLQLRSMKRRGDRLQEELTAARQALKDEQQGSAARISGLESKLEEKETMVAPLSVENEASAPDVVEEEILKASSDDGSEVEETPESVEEDDLQRIRGIGPVLQRKLKNSGVISFRQIAAWTDEDLVEMARRIGVGAGRIRKGGWVESARELQGR